MMTRQQISQLLVLAALMVTGLTCSAQTININVSYHVVTNTSGVRPTGVLDTDIRAAFALANEHMAGFLRGYRYNLVEIVNIGSNGQPGGPSDYYNVEINYNNIQAFNNAAKSDARYLFRNNAVNLFVTTTPYGGGLCSFPGDPYEVVWINTSLEWWVLAHEIGHYYNLFHTHGGCQCDSTAGCFNTAFGGHVGDDGVGDTIPDRDCFLRDDLSFANYGTAYSNPARTAEERKAMDDTYFNIMSYHGGDAQGVGSRDDFQDRFTELQLDRLTDAANSPRAATMSGKTRFVTTTGNDLNTGLVSNAPKRTVASAVASSQPTDIVLLRSGSYNEPITITRAVTLRVPRNSVAVIGQ